MTARKYAFYAKNPLVINELEKVGGRQISQRIDELALKGLEMESQEKIRVAYQAYASQLMAQDAEENTNDNQIMSASLFKDEDETDDWY